MVLVVSVRLMQTAQSTFLKILFGLTRLKVSGATDAVIGAEGVGFTPMVSYSKLVISSDMVIPRFNYSPLAF